MNVEWNKLEAKPGDLVLPAWHAMTRAVRAMRLIQGRGVRLGYSTQGTVISADDSGGGDFSHPFTVMLAGDGVTVSRGMVDGVEAEIDGVAVSGAGGAQPILRVKAGEMDASTLQSWVCVEVTPNAAGTLDAGAVPLIVHRGAAESSDPAVGRHPLALLVWESAGASAPGQVVPVTYFNLRYARTSPAAGQGVARHFFL